jgi:hypothetical protein
MIGFVSRRPAYTSVAGGQFLFTDNLLVGGLASQLHWARLWRRRRPTGRPRLP